MATFRLRRANLIPMQFLGPAPKGRYVYGSMVSLFSLLNLDNDVLGEKKWRQEIKNLSIYLFRDLLLRPYRNSLIFMQSVSAIECCVRALVQGGRWDPLPVLEFNFGHPGQQKPHGDLGSVHSQNISFLLLFMRGKPGVTFGRSSLCLQSCLGMRGRGCLWK